MFILGGHAFLYLGADQICSWKYKYIWLIFGKNNSRGCLTLPRMQCVIHFFYLCVICVHERFKDYTCLIFHGFKWPRPVQVHYKEITIQKQNWFMINWLIFLNHEPMNRDSLFYWCMTHFHICGLGWCWIVFVKLVILKMATHSLTQRILGIVRQPL